MGDTVTGDRGGAYSGRAVGIARVETPQPYHGQQGGVMRREIVRVYEPEVGQLPEDGYLDYEGDTIIGTVVSVARSDVSLEQLADMCDQHAESRNNHKFVGAHRMLAAILWRTVGRDEAQRVMWEVASYGGLDYASGCGTGSRPELEAWDDFGIAECWKDWQLP